MVTSAVLLVLQVIGMRNKFSPLPHWFPNSREYLSLNQSFPPVSIFIHTFKRDSHRPKKKPKNQKPKNQGKRKRKNITTASFFEKSAKCYHGISFVTFIKNQKNSRCFLFFSLPLNASTSTNDPSIHPSRKRLFPSSSTGSGHRLHPRIQPTILRPALLHRAIHALARLVTTTPELPLHPDER